eukprot:TRINITY_DN66485_c0_g1_i2.p1 TRINITY_DN66485_c0_g1~~TRINITY_DN66485_c0_g1_i2.p1  ORF type:complete len:604 (-),score=39.76 TRINITY_DN66485_c0_g1_i2:169-1959(-)
MLTKATRLGAFVGEGIRGLDDRYVLKRADKCKEFWEMLHHDKCQLHPFLSWSDSIGSGKTSLMQLISQQYPLELIPTTSWREIFKQPYFHFSYAQVVDQMKELTGRAADFLVIDDAQLHLYNDTIRAGDFYTSLKERSWNCKLPTLLFISSRNKTVPTSTPVEITRLKQLFPEKKQLLWLSEEETGEYLQSHFDFLDSTSLHDLTKLLHTATNGSMNHLHAISYYLYLHYCKQNIKEGPPFTTTDVQRVIATEGANIIHTTRTKVQLSELSEKDQRHLQRFAVTGKLREENHSLEVLGLTTYDHGGGHTWRNRLVELSVLNRFFRSRHQPNDIEFVGLADAVVRICSRIQTEYLEFSERLKDGTPAEALQQVEFFRALTSVIPAHVGVTPERNDEDCSKRLDFFIDSDLDWGFELMTVRLAKNKPPHLLSSDVKAQKDAVIGHWKRRYSQYCDKWVLVVLYDAGGIQSFSAVTTQLVNQLTDPSVECEADYVAIMELGAREFVLLDKTGAVQVGPTQFLQQGKLYCAYKLKEFEVVEDFSVPVDVPPQKQGIVVTVQQEGSEDGQKYKAQDVESLKTQGVEVRFQVHSPTAFQLRL